MTDHAPQIDAAFWRVSPVHVEGAPGRRLMVVLRTRGCEYARKTGGCTVCGFLEHADLSVDDDGVAAQLEDVIDATAEVGLAEIDVLTLGSFLNDSEVSPALRHRLLRRVADVPSVRRVSFESRAEYISVDELLTCREILGDRIVELGIGLESADDRVRNELINKGLERDAFLHVVDQVADAGLRLLVYLLIKPPGLSETEAIEDAVASAKFVFDAARERGVRARVAFEPVFVCRNTELERIYKASRYRLVNLWSVVEVVRRVHSICDGGEVFVGLSDEDLAKGRVAGSCPECSDDVVVALERFNAEQDVSVFDGLLCDCRDDWLASLGREESS